MDFVYTAQVGWNNKKKICLTQTLVILAKVKLKKINKINSCLKKKNEWTQLF